MMSALDNLIEEARGITIDDLIEDARGRGVRDIDDLPVYQQRRMLALTVPILDESSFLDGVDLLNLVADAMMAGMIDVAVKRHSEISWAVYTAYRDAATRYINRELNNGK